MSEAGGTPGPAANLLKSLVQLSGTLLAAAQTRVELLTTEISEDLERGLQILLWAFVAALAALGVRYVPLVLDQTAFAEIMAS